MNSVIRVVIADDHPVIVEGVKNALAVLPSVRVVGVASRFDQVPSTLKEARPDILILDLSGMGDMLFGLMQRIRREFPSVRVIVFSSVIHYAPDLLDLGAKGYVTKGEMTDNLVEVVKAVIHGEVSCSPKVRAFLEILRGERALTPREHQALQLYLQGKETAEIATEMQIKPHSVQNLFNSMYEKTQSKGRRQLIQWYKRKNGTDEE